MRPGPTTPRPTTPPQRNRKGRLVLVTVVTVAVLAGTVVAVKLAWPTHGGAAVVVAASAANPPGSGTGAEPGVPAIGQGPAGAVSVNPSNVRSSARPGPTPASGAAGDEFSSAALDTSKWAVYGDKGTSPYAADMVGVSGGELQVRGVGKNPTAAANKSGGLCWCGDGGNRLYGRWQVRARFDAGSGYRQVLVLWPQSDNSSADGSITFVSDGDAARKSLGVVLLPPGGATAARVFHSGDFTAWHVYTVDWRAGYVKVSVDSTLIYDSTAGAGAPTIPHKPMHLAIQQDKGPGDGVPAPNSSTPAQVVMHIDWVHLFR
jgi:hypothetical protein